MHTETTKMIYAEKAVADAIAAKLTQVNEKKYDVYKVTTGFQVVPITVCKAYVPPAKPAPVMKLNMAAEKEKAPGEVIVLKYKLHMEHPKTIHIIAKSDGLVKWLHKSGMISWELFPEEGYVLIKYAKKVAEKKGVIPWAIEQVA